MLKVLEGARIPCLREQGVSPEGNARPADILLLHWQGGQDAAVDITVSHPAQPGEYPLRLESMKVHTKRCEESKFRKNGQLCDVMGWACVPFAVDTWGGLGPSARGCFQQILKRATASLEGREKTRKSAEIYNTVALSILVGAGRQLEAALHVQVIDTADEAPTTPKGRGVRVKVQPPPPPGDGLTQTRQAWQPAKQASPLSWRARWTVPAWARVQLVTTLSHQAAERQGPANGGQTLHG